MREHLLTCPLTVKVSARKGFALNLNSYRNAYHHTLNKAKVEFMEVMIPQIKKLPQMQRIECFFTLYRKDNRRCDTRNICTIVDKFLLDAIVRLKRLPDDDYMHDLKGVYCFGGVDKNNPRVDVIIREI